MSSGYLGPFLSFNNVLVDHYTSRKTCSNPKCIHYRCLSWSKYCTNCGSEITENQFIEKRDLHASEVVGVDVFVQCKIDDKNILLPNSKGDWTFIDYENFTRIINFADLNVAASLVNFNQKYEQEIKKLGNIISNLEVSYGFINLGRIRLY